MVVVVPSMRSDCEPCDGSFIKMSSKELTEKAKKSLATIKLRKEASIQRLIDREREEIIQSREKKRNSLWSRIFGYKETPIPSDEDILDSIKHPPPTYYIHIPETAWIDMRYNKYEDVAYRLINAAKYADEVYVSTQDLERLL